MTGARTSTLADFARQHRDTSRPTAMRTCLTGWRSAMPTLIRTLQGGLALGAMHEVFAEAGRQVPRRPGLSRALRGGRSPAANGLGASGFRRD